VSVAGDESPTLHECRRRRPPSWRRRKAPPTHAAHPYGARRLLRRGPRLGRRDLRWAAPQRQHLDTSTPGERALIVRDRPGGQRDPRQSATRSLCRPLVALRPTDRRRRQLRDADEPHPRRAATRSRASRSRARSIWHRSAACSVARPGGEPPVRRRVLDAGRERRGYTVARTLLDGATGADDRV